ncbi:unnamed protein product [Leptidea sinapis]|uniref:C-type lectin domain-containing protein n=1 Tax=Leptidea sinapis TaxID=189913 RepID=A0A5E4PRL6_9NEOP|nr:unnamed protein product [Leptidea sinapis]
MYIFVTNLYVSAVILALSTVIEAARPKFRDDYRYEKAFDAFYKLHTEPFDWYQARIRCESEGSQLLVPISLDEADSIPLLIAPILTRFEGVFVGVHDLYSERSFVTIEGYNTGLTLGTSTATPQRR